VGTQPVHEYHDFVREDRARRLGAANVDYADGSCPLTGEHEPTEIAVLCEDDALVTTREIQHHLVFGSRCDGSYGEDVVARKPQGSDDAGVAALVGKEP
jgi:hypothetical protein